MDYLTMYKKENQCHRTWVQQEGSKKTTDQEHERHGHFKRHDGDGGSSPGENLYSNNLPQGRTCVPTTSSRGEPVFQQLPCGECRGGAWSLLQRRDPFVCVCANYPQCVCVNYPQCVCMHVWVAFSDLQFYQGRYVFCILFVNFNCQRIFNSAKHAHSSSKFIALVQEGKMSVPLSQNPIQIFTL